MKSQCKNKIASLKNQFFFFNFSILMKWNHIYLEFDSLVGLMTLSTFPLTMFKQSFSFLTSIVYENASNYRSLSNRVNDAVEQCGLEYRHWKEDKMKILCIRQYNQEDNFQCPDIICPYKICHLQWKITGKTQ